MAEQTPLVGSKAELLARMREGREVWNGLIAEIPDSAITEPVLPGGWSVKDLVAHVAAYENWTAAQIRAANERREPTNLELYGVEDVPEDPEGWDLDRVNAAIYERYANTPLADVRTFAEHAFADLIAAIEAVPERDLMAKDVQSWTGGEALINVIPRQATAHYEHHLDDLRAVSGQDTY
jgi:hypothetical protein